MTDYSKSLSNYQRGFMGRECYFVPINEKIGAKLFYYYKEKEVEKIQQRQMLAFTNELGPEPFEIIKHNKMFGYITEIVKVIPVKRNIAGDPLVETRKFTQEERLDLHRLKNDLNEIGFTFWDMFEGNIGWKSFNNKERMVCIDFG
jgi:hypothetical protein